MKSIPDSPSSEGPRKVVRESVVTAEALDASLLQRSIEDHVGHLVRIAAALPENLALIEAAAAGKAVDREQVLTTTGQVLEYLCRGLLSPRISVPKDFWFSPLGLSIARAHAQVITDAEVMSQAEAAQHLGVSREYISQLVEGGKVATVVREAAAPRSRKQPREMLYRASVDALRPLIRSEKERKVKEAAWYDGHSPHYAQAQTHRSDPSHVS